MLNKCLKAFIYFGFNLLCAQHDVEYKDTDDNSRHQDLHVTSQLQDFTFRKHMEYIYLLLFFFRETMLSSVR